MVLVSLREFMAEFPDFFLCEKREKLNQNEKPFLLRFFYFIDNKNLVESRTFSSKI